MKNGSFEHLKQDGIRSIRTNWYDKLFTNSLSHIFFRNPLFCVFIKACQTMLSYAIAQIRKIEIYYRP